MAMAAHDPVNAMLDLLVKQVQAHFGAFIRAQTCHVFGSDVLDACADDACVTTTLGLNIEIEPIPVKELREFRAVNPNFIVEVFHGKLVQDWHNLLSKIFAHYVDLHFNGQRPFVEEGVTQVKADFRQEVPVLEQMRVALQRDFDFRKYVDRQKLILKLRDEAGSSKDEAETILQHIHIRNAIQHHGGVLGDFVFKELGCHQFTVLDHLGASQTLKLGDIVAVSGPELDRFRRALLMIAQRWKKK